MDMGKFFPKIPPHLIAEHDQYEAAALKWWMSLGDVQHLALITTVENLGAKDKPPPEHPQANDEISKWVAWHIGKLAGYAIGQLAILAQQQQEENEDEPERPDE